MATGYELWRAEADRAPALAAWLRTLAPGDRPAIQGPVCGAWYEAHPADFDCPHDSCYRVAYRDAPAHGCAVEADHDDPMSQAYGMYLATCDVCDAWQAALERYHDEVAWEAAIERGNR
jgi:hypothetical protein